MAIITGTAAAELLNGTAANDTISGLGGDDTLVGNGGNDTLDGGLGNDSMAGGAGNDLYFVNAALDTVIEAAGLGSGTDTVQSSVTFTLPVNVEKLILTGGANINGTGNTLANNLTGNTGANSLSGLGGADTLDGGAGADTLDGGAGADSLVGGAGNDTLIWDALDAKVSGGADTDTLRVTGSTALNLAAVAGAKIVDVEVIDLAGTGTLTLTAADVVAISTTDILRVMGGAGDSLSAGSGWLYTGNISSGGQVYAQYMQGAATILQVDTDISRAVGFRINVSSLDGAAGFRITGGANYDNAGSVSSAGDVNGDGFDDLLVGALNYGAADNGAAYVVFGKNGGFTNVSLSALGAAEGFRIAGGADADIAGYTVSAAGDVNGDGFDDLLVGAQGYGTNGAAYVVFGKSGGFTSASLSALGAAEGFRIAGDVGDAASRSVSSAGDVNGDGYDDLLVGAPGYYNNSGAAYVVFGHGGGFTNISLSALDAADGFRIAGDVGDSAGRAVSSAGDVNGDGFDDLLVGAYRYGVSYNGAAYVVFGHGGGFTNISLSALDAADGFQITGVAINDQVGRSVSSAGDVNGDGFDDLLVGTPYYGLSNNGVAYVVFGHGGGFTDIDLSALGAGEGFRITGGANGDAAGFSVSSAGDVNGDGFDDLLIGVSNYGTYNNGAAWVVFGKSGGFTDVSLSALGAAEGFRIVGGANGDYAGFSVSGAGDVNGDGFDDLLVGAPNFGAYDNGAAYVVFGADFRGEVDFAGTAGSDALNGTGADEILIGGRGKDTLTGGGGADVLKGGAGTDVLIFDAADFRAEGGTGRDTLRVQGFGASLDLRASAETAFSGIEVIDLTGSGDNTLTLDAAGLAALTEGFHMLRVNGNAGDSVSAGTGWLYTGNIANGGQTYAQYTQGTAVLQVDTDISRDVGFSIDVSSLSGANGFQISGEGVNDLSGFSIADAGDVNGDGYADVIVGAPDAVPNGIFAGASYVVFGKAGGFGSNFNLSVLNGTNGFRISGEAVSDYSGRSVSAAGDVNGDGYGDLIVGAEAADPHGSLSGASYVVFGRASGFGADLALSSLNGANGFQISGVGGGDHSGFSVSDAGDVNGDGYADVIVGAREAIANGVASGASYVVFGQAGGYAANINLSALNGANGFQISGEALGEYSGRSVSTAGDVNGDGFDDLIMGSPYADPHATNSGASHVVFGKASGFGAEIDLSSLNGTNGFQISGEALLDRSGRSVSAAGDVNGDGFGDVIVGARYSNVNGSTSGASYVVFGKAGGFGANLDLTALDGTNGFQISGEAAGDNSGMSVSAAGDVNGDGYGDLIVGAFAADPNVNNAGASYVVFGAAGGFGSNLDLSALDGTTGFQISGEAEEDLLGRAVSAAGDVNGDGFDDLIMGTPYADPNGDYSGASFVVFGRDYRGDVDFLGGAGNNNFTGTAADEILIGGRGNDTLAGGDGIDVLKGGAGDDVLVHDASDFRADGGGGFDILRVDGADGTVILGRAYSGIEAVDLTGSGDNTLILSVRDVLDLSDATHTLRVDGNDGDELISTAQGWLIGEEVEIGGTIYQSYIKGAATLLVDTDVTQFVG